MTAESLTVKGRASCRPMRGRARRPPLLTIRREDKNEPMSLEAALALAASSDSPFLVNRQSGRAALAAPASSLTLDDGSVEERVRLIRPLSRDASCQRETREEPLERGIRRGRIYRRLAERAFRDPADAVERNAPRDRPVASRLEASAARHGKVYRLQTDEGEQIVGRSDFGGPIAGLRPPSISTAARR